MSSSSTSSTTATGLNRSRSLRQPNAGLVRSQRNNEARKGGEVARATAQAGQKKRALPPPGASSASAAPPPPPPSSDEPRNMSPSRLPKPGASSSIPARTRSMTATMGATTTTTTTTAATNVAPTRIAAGTRSRPTSGIFSLDRTSNSLAAARKPLTRSQASEESPEPMSRAARPVSMITTNTTRTARPRSIASLSQLSSTASALPSPPPSTTTASKPSATSTAKPQSPRTTAHARARSTATSLSSTTTLRPPRPPSAGSVASTSTADTSMAAAAATASKRTLGRANTIAARAAQQRQAPAGSSAATAAPAPATTATRAPRPTSITTADAASRLRPAFTTLQQHYSPARNPAPKPLTSTYLAPPTPSKLPANIALSSETARTQAELLQLHLLHRDADAVAASWHASARERLGKRFAELAEADAEVAAEEAAVQQARDSAALRAWGQAAPGGGGEKGLEDRIQVLDGVLSGLWSVSGPGGRHARAVRGFEKWLGQMTVAVEARCQAGGLGALMESGEVAFIGELDPAWRDEVSSLSRKLDGWRRQLGQLEEGVPGDCSDDHAGGGGGDKGEGEGEDQPRSSLARILAGCRGLVCGMLAELDVMERIEREAIAQEAAWIRRMNRDEDGTDENSTPRPGAIWRVF